MHHRYYRLIDRMRELIPLLRRGDVGGVKLFVKLDEDNHDPANYALLSRFYWERPWERGGDSDDYTEWNEDRFKRDLEEFVKAHFQAQFDPTIVFNFRYTSQELEVYRKENENQMSQDEVIPAPVGRKLFVIKGVLDYQHAGCTEAVVTVLDGPEDADLSRLLDEYKEVNPEWRRLVGRDCETSGYARLFSAWLAGKGFKPVVGWDDFLVNPHGM